MFISRHTKVDVPNSITYLNPTLIFEWYLIRCGSENGYQTYMWTTCSNMITIPGSIVNIVEGGFYDQMMLTLELIDEEFGRCSPLLCSSFFLWRRPRYVALHVFV